MAAAIEKRKIFLALMILSLLMLTGCEPPPPEPTYTVGDEFRELYDNLGGETKVGLCISPLFEINGIKYQYTQKLLMVYNPNAPTANQYSLGTIGYDILPDLGPLPPGGYTVWEEVLPLYQETGGIFGIALTDMLYNEEYDRYEQYFVGAGFYRYATDPIGMIHMMDYGATLCGVQCELLGNTQVWLPTPMVTPDSDYYTQILVAHAQRLSEVLTGRLLTPKAYPAASDGWYEIIYQNVVIAVNPANVDEITLRHLPEIMGYQSDPLVVCKPRTGSMCYSFGDGLVRMVEVVFYDFIVSHGGFEISGAPQTSLRPHMRGGSYQCFENYCLHYRDNAPEALRVSLMPLGQLYQNRDQNAEVVPSNATDGLLIQTWPRYPMVTLDQAQEIIVLAMEGTFPVESRLFRLSLTYPDGTVLVKEFPLTDANGQASITLSPITAPDGTIVPYRACYLGMQEQPVCIEGSFVIWGSVP